MSRRKEVEFPVSFWGSAGWNRVRHCQQWNCRGRTICLWLCWTPALAQQADEHLHETKAMTQINLQSAEKCVVKLLYVIVTVENSFGFCRRNLSAWLQIAKLALMLFNSCKMKEIMAAQSAARMLTSCVTSCGPWTECVVFNPSTLLFLKTLNTETFQLLHSLFVHKPVEESNKISCNCWQSQWKKRWGQRARNTEVKF